MRRAVVIWIKPHTRQSHFPLRHFHNAPEPKLLRDQQMPLIGTERHARHWPRSKQFLRRLGRLEIFLLRLRLPNRQNAQAKNDDAWVHSLLAKIIPKPARHGKLLASRRADGYFDGRC